MKEGKEGLSALNEVGNGGQEAISTQEPYSVEFEIVGTRPLLFHRWDCDSVEAKSKASKNSHAKKSDDVESYVYRTEEGELALPGEYVRQAIIQAGKFAQDPRSPRKSAADLLKAAIVSETYLASLGVKAWDAMDRRRVVIQRAGVTRQRPSMNAGWKARFIFSVVLPEYVSPDWLQMLLTNAGRFVGLGDFRPSFGGFQVTEFKVVIP